MNTRTRRNAVPLGLLALLATLVTAPAPAPAAEIGTNDFQISQQTDPGGIAMSGVAYNSTTDQYLVVWEGINPAVPLKAEIRGQLIDARTGAALAPNDFLVASIPGDADTDAQAPDVVYNPARNEFVVVFIADEFDEEPPLIVDTFEVYAQRVSAAGAPTGPPLRVSDMGDDDANGSFDAGSGLDGPQIAYNATDGEYLVVWRGDDNTAGLVNNELEIFGQRLTHPAGGLTEVGTNDIQISDVGGANGTGAFDAREPSVAWNSTNNEYLVAWQADDNEGGAVDNRFHIWGQRIGSTGAQPGTNDFRISTVGGVADTDVETFSPDVVHNSGANEYLVVWEGDGANSSAGTANDFEIWGQRFSGAAASPVGTTTQISQMGTPGAGNFTAQFASAAYNPNNGEYLVAWKGDTNTGGLVDDENEVFGTRLSTALGTVEAPRRLSDLGPNGVANPAPTPPAVAYSERAVNDYLLTWAGENPGVTSPGETEVWGQLVAPESDLRLTKSASPASPGVGDVVTYTLGYTNAGPDAAFDVVITDLLPAALTNPSFTSTGPPVSQRPGTTFVWDIASLSSGQSGTITITGTVSDSTAEGTVLTNTASITTTTAAPDPAAGNNSQAAAITVDGPPRLLSVNRSGASPTNAASVSFTVTFDQGVTGVTASNFALVTTGSVSDASITSVAGTGATRTVTVSTGTGDGTIRLDMVNGTGVVDTGAVGGKPLVTSNLPFAGQVYLIDKTAPTLSLTSAAPNPTNMSPIHVSATFSEPVTGFAVADLAVMNGTASNLTGGGASYEFDVTPAGQGLVTVDVASGAATDAAGNISTAAAQFRRTFDSVAPTVTLSSSSPDPTNVSPIPVTAQFSEAVSGFGAGDVSTANATVESFTAADADTYTFDLVPAGQGLVTADVAAAVASDSAGNPNAAAAQLRRTFDDVAPTTTLSSSAPDPTNAAPIPVQVEFSEDMTGFTAGDVVVDNGTAANFSGSGSSYSFDVTPTGQGEVRVDVPADVAADAAGNGNAAAARLTRQFDSVRPEVTINQAPGQPDPTGSSPIVYAVEFTEAVTGFTGSDVVLSGTAGATTAVVTGAGTSLRVEVSGMTGRGTVTASVPADGATDAAGNLSQAATSTDDTVTFVTGSGPVIAVATGGSCMKGGSAGRMMLTVSDPDRDPVTIRVASSNPRAVPLSRIRVDDRLPGQSVTIEPVRQPRAATSMVTLTAGDGSFTSQLAIQVIVGTAGADTIVGNGGSDLIVGGPGNDTGEGHGGPDTVCGGPGDDQLHGGPVADTLDGSDGLDRLSAGNGADKLIGRASADRLFGRTGDDRLLGGPGPDRLAGGPDADAFSGGIGPDVFTDFSRAQGDTTDGT